MVQFSVASVGSLPPTFSLQKASVVVAFLILWTLAERLREDTAPSLSPLQFAATDILRLLISLAIWYTQRQHESRDYQRLPIGATFGDGPSEEQPLDDFTLSSEDSHQSPISRSNVDHREPRRSNLASSGPGGMRPILSVLAIGLIFGLRAYVDSRRREIADPFVLYLAIPATAFCTLFVLQFFFGRIFPASFWHAAALQFAGLFIVRDAFVSSSTEPPYSVLVAWALCNSMLASLLDVAYRYHRSTSVHVINALVFASSCILHLSSLLMDPSHDVSFHPYNMDFTPASHALPLIEAGRDIAAMFIIHQYDAIMEGILVSVASTFLITVFTLRLIYSPPSAFVGCGIATAASAIYMLSIRQRSDEQPTFQTRRLVAAAATFIVALTYTCAVLLQQRIPTLSASFPSWRGGFDAPPTVPECHRTALPSHAQAQGDYDHFKNVLLIVFFSHARYNANLDYHKEVYSRYFPNIIYIGPASREDKGFAHSYDVFVDSFQSDEDLSDPSFYKMAGRMAHHMLYTALKDHDCYDGYLWAPFDTLLNVPRLQQFNQSLFWYHSPWGLPVPNPALGDVEPEFALNKSRHAPPANISPDTSVNLTETWRGWGLDWWWGDPHVGVSVCMDAFRKVPLEMRTYLSALTDGATRLIGGSADTLYIPGRHRQVFMHVLALFLETDCFLEIATPTAVHLVLPPDEHIQFVDHWWIYEPPFNASFVRQKWEEGFEVDTFHTFHWGERGEEDGVWRGDHGHVEDVQHLLQESAMRQGVDFPA
ncbi:hypothetical protein F5I97DRAFT_1928401 [Phlebopus sp. FC_14]|nr:hypothetical protein F5I97DRAFT_1928401 [Phlebopus sp. FC_14]